MIRTFQVLLSLWLLTAAGVFAGIPAERLPLTGAKLENGEPYTILALGDSVTHTGDYPAMLGKRLAEFTGNRRIRVVKRTHPGCSADATVRHFERDVTPYRPDLVLILYGLNDQICMATPETWHANYRYIADRARREFNSDVIFLTPPPHPDIRDKSPDDRFPWRTGLFAAWLRRAETVTPVVDLFAAFGSRKADDFPSLISDILTLYPARDHIHPNAAGHALIADTVFRHLTAQPPAQAPLELTGAFRWNPARVEVTVRNRSEQRRSGRISLFAPYPMPGENRHRPYDLAPGETTVIRLDYPQLTQPEQQLQPPWSWYVKNDRMAVTAVDFSHGEATVTALPCPRTDVPFVPPATPPRITAESGRIPLIQKQQVRELVFLRNGSVLPGEVETDGDLAEWHDHLWSTVGLPHQARNRSQALDFRRTPAEKVIYFAHRAGRDRLSIALRLRGKIDPAENGALFFDSRAPEQFHTVGPYYWMNLKLAPNGTVAIRSGDTSPKDCPPTGRWRPTPDGADVELQIPYRWMGLNAFPASGKLAFSLIWNHVAEGRTTQLNWSESGHQWTPVNYGELTLQSRPDAIALPCHVRIE